MKNIYSALVAVAASTFAAPILADEAWTIYGEDIVYEADLENGIAVLAHKDGKLFIEGLAGETTRRSEYDGIIIRNRDSKMCDVGIANPQTGEVSYSWGRIHMVFIDPEPPSRWMAFGAECLKKELKDPIFAEPVVGE